MDVAAVIRVPEYQVDGMGSSSQRRPQYQDEGKEQSEEARTEAESFSVVEETEAAEIHRQILDSKTWVLLRSQQIRSPLPPNTEHLVRHYLTYSSNIQSANGVASN